MSLLVAALLLGTAAPAAGAFAMGRGTGAPESGDTAPQASIATTVAPTAFITPGMINTRARGRWVNARLDFGSGADASQVDTSSLVISVAGVSTTLTPSAVRVSTESTGVLVARISRQAFAALLSDGSNVVTISGVWLDGTPFTATTTVRAKTPGGGKGHAKSHDEGHGKGAAHGNGNGNGHGHGNSAAHGNGKGHKK
jgi:hypothetical protein